MPAVGAWAGGADTLGDPHSPNEMRRAKGRPALARVRCAQGCRQRRLRWRCLAQKCRGHVLRRQRALRVKPELMCPQGARRLSRGPAAPSPAFGVASCKQVSGWDRTEPMGRVSPARQPDTLNPAQTRLRGSPQMKERPAFLMVTHCKARVCMLVWQRGIFSFQEQSRGLCQRTAGLSSPSLNHSGL